MKICDNIKTLIPTLRLAPGQVLLSHNTIIDALHKLRHGRYYTETCFNEVKWAQWSSNPPPIITSNIHKGIPMQGST